MQKDVYVCEYNRIVIIVVKSNRNQEKEKRKKCKKKEEGNAIQSRYVCVYVCVFERLPTFTSISKFSDSSPLLRLPTFISSFHILSLIYKQIHKKASF